MKSELVYLGLALVHFIWQGILIAAGLPVILYFIKSASTRYVVCSFALFLMPLCLICTVWLVHQNLTDGFISRPTPGHSQDHGIINGAGSPVSRPPNLFFNLPPESADKLDKWMPMVANAWLVGVALLSLRKAGGFFLVWRLGHRGVLMPSRHLLEQFHRACRKLQVAGARLKLSYLISIPITIGWFQPLVLLPVSLLSGLSSQEIELILEHELAHIRRHDYLVNILQTIVETFFFFHPVTWWISNRIRQERENACDDLLLAAEPDKALIYAKALIRLEKLRPVNSWLVVAATGGSLLHRVRRVLGQHQEPFPQIGFPLFFILASLLFLTATPAFTPIEKMSAAEAKEKNIAALVDREPIFWPEVDAKAADVYTTIKNHTTGTEQQNRLSEARRGILTDLINRKLMIACFKKSGGSIPEDYMDGMISNRIARLYGGDEKFFYQDLKRRSISINAYREDIENEAIVNYMKNIHILDKLRQYYEDHPEHFPQYDKLNISAISFLCVGNTDAETKAVAEEAERKTKIIQDQLKDGVSFNDLLAKYSEFKSPFWVYTGFINSSSYPMSYPFIHEIERLKPGQISSVVKTIEAYYIVRLNERRLATVTNTKELEESEHQKYQAIQNKIEKEWMDSLQEGAAIQRFD